MSEVINNTSVYEFTVSRSGGATENLSKYQGQVLLIVNTASKCGFTGQYAGLEALYQRYTDKPFNILAFPCNQFGGQEPGSDNEIQSFCELNYGVSFPLFEKIEVNGANAHPLFTFLKKSAPGVMGTEGIKWNFTKFLIGTDGQILERFGPQTKPESLIDIIDAALA